jgi:hypothetical protein
MGHCGGHEGFSLIHDGDTHRPGWNQRDPFPERTSRNRKYKVGVEPAIRAREDKGGRRPRRPQQLAGARRFLVSPRRHGGHREGRGVPPKAREGRRPRGPQEHRAREDGVCRGPGGGKRAGSAPVNSQAVLRLTQSRTLGLSHGLLTPPGPPAADRVLRSVGLRGVPCTRAGPDGRVRTAPAPRGRHPRTRPALPDQSSCRSRSGT